MGDVTGRTPVAYGLRPADARRAATRLPRVALLAACTMSVGAACSATLASRDLAELSLEQLSSIVVTSVSRREERLADAPASVFVITAEAIRRSGATSLPEALRLAPNLDVARADANQYAISARGFDNVLANKMLVLIDGRVVYTPLFSGVFWEAQDVLLEDVDRIEVISGPGATLWGANAVNGVINVITRSAMDTQGNLAVGGIGNRESAVALRHGGAFGAGGRYRIYAKYNRRDASTLENGGTVRDESMRYQTGFRTDFARGADEFTLQGDAYHGDIDQAPAPRRVDGANVLGRWTRDLGGDSTLTTQAYFDYTDRDHPQSFHENLGTLDVAAQYAFVPVESHQVLAGAGYRVAWDRVTNSVAQAFLPADRELRWGHVFAQDEIALGPAVTLTLGAKVETNVYTGAEFLPNARIAWRLGHDRLLWGAISRAVRAPSRIDRDFYLPGVPPHVVVGNDTFSSEVADVGEIGYRSQPVDGFTYSVTAFYDRYDRLRSYEPVPGNPTWGNGAQGYDTGVEGWATLRIAPAWHVTAGGVAMREHLWLRSDSRDPGLGLPTLGNDPSAWWSVRSSLDVTPQHAFELALRHVGPRPNPAVPAYTTLDARWIWKARSDLEISVVGQDLVGPAHAEWGAAPSRVVFERTVFLKVTWQP